MATSFINSTKTTNLILIGVVVVIIAGVVYFWHKKSVKEADDVLVNVQEPETPKE